MGARAQAFAAAISIVSSCLIASAFFDFDITIFFVLGSAAVLLVRPPVPNGVRAVFGPDMR